MKKNDIITFRCKTSDHRYRAQFLRQTSTELWVSVFVVRRGAAPTMKKNEGFGNSKTLFYKPHYENFRTLKTKTL